MKRLCAAFLFSFIIVAPLSAADKVFQESGYGYTINYPQDWGYAKQSAHIIVFTKKEGVDAKVPVVGIQNLLSTKVKDGKHKDVSTVLGDFENQLRITKHAKVYPVQTFSYNKNGSKLTGKQFIAEYILKDKNYKQWVIVIPRKNGEVFHVWIYTAPEEKYDKYSTIAQAMLDSLVITE